ncbi:MAG TPA: VTT domain-containing protein [Hanamia sp.]|nr:VTT domain-containing protein [Hanamia sp.]
MLFTAGVFIATGNLPGNIFIICVVLTMASFLGNITGYGLGLKAGPIIYKQKESWYFKRKHLYAAETFYKKYGNIALAAGLFFPLIRTFAPVVAGMIQLNFRRFMLFTFIDSVLWIISFVMAGYLIGTMPFLKPYLKYIVIGIILSVTTSIIIGIVRTLNKTGKRPRL